MKKPFTAFNHGIGPTILFEPCLEYRPEETHLKEDGTVDDRPSFAILMRRDDYPSVVGQISLDMLNDGLKDIGYKLEKL